MLVGTPTQNPNLKKWPADATVKGAFFDSFKLVSFPISAIKADSKGGWMRDTLNAERGTAP